MNVLSAPNLAQSRQYLQTLELDRRDPRRRELFWDGEKWLQSLMQVMRLEDDRDRGFRRRLIDARAVRGADVATLQKRYYDVLDEDIRWYKAREAEMRGLRERWESEALVDVRIVDELVYHHNQIVYRLCEQQVLLRQLAIEILEVRRLRREHVPAARWSICWNDLCVAFRAHDAAYRPQVAGQSLQEVHDQWLQWCLALRAGQRSMRRAWFGVRKDERRELEDATRLVDEMIAELQPARAWRINGSLTIGVCVLAMLIGACLALSVHRSNANTLQPTVSRPTVPRPTVPRPTAPQPTISVVPDAAALNRQGIEFLKQSRYEDALALFKQAVAANRSWHEPLNNMAFCLYELGQSDQAITRWREAIVLNPNGQDAHAGLGMALYQAGRYNEGLAEYREAIRLGGNYQDEDWMRSERLWSPKALADSRPLRDGLVQ